jgi:hypothetical protein
MKLDRHVAQQLAAPVLAAFLLLGGGIATLMATDSFVTMMRLDRQAAAAERRTAQDKLSRATEEEREIRDKIVDYRRLLERGVIGDEQRLDWVETIGQIKANRKVFDVKYAISPQKALDLPGVVGASDVEFRVSELKLDMQLLHEEDLLRVVEDLRRQLKSHVMVRSCRVERLPGASAERGAGPRLRADCVLDLVTIRDKRLTPAA